LYSANWFLYYKNYYMKHFHISWLICVSIIYYLNLLMIPLITFLLIPNVDPYKYCFNMNSIMFSRYNNQICFLLFVFIFGLGTIIYLAALLSLSKYLNLEEKENNNEIKKRKGKEGIGAEGVEGAEEDLLNNEKIFINFFKNTIN